MMAVKILQVIAWCAIKEFLTEDTPALWRLVKNDTYFLERLIQKCHSWKMEARS
jgi:hypothetical protein